MTNKDWVEMLKAQGIYDVLTSGVSLAEMVKRLAKGRDPARVEYKIRMTLDVLADREANPDGIIA